MHAYSHCSWASYQRRCAGLALLALLAVAECHAPAASTPPAATGPAVTVAAVERAPFATTRDFTGNVQAQSVVNVLPKATGRIEQLFVDVGSAVQAGDPIAVLDRNQLEASVQQAGGALQVAQARLDLLLAQGRPEAIQEAQAQLVAAEARLSLLQEGAGRPTSLLPRPVSGRRRPSSVRL